MLRSWLLSWLLPLALILSAKPPRVDPAPLPQEVPDRAQVERLIRQLSSDDFDEREAASRQLRKIGPPAVEALRAAAADSKDAEVRRRAGDIAAVIENCLEQLLIDYRALGLPLPPKDAPLMRFEGEGGRVVKGKVQPWFGLAFLLKPGSDTEPWTLLQGTFERQVEWDQKVQEVKPEPDAVKDLSDSGQALGLALQCYARGWQKLAEHLLERHRKDSGLPPHQALIQDAWYYWKDELTRPKVDRAPMARRLKELIGKDKDLDTERNRALLRSLELAVVPSKAKSGSVEALIDGLVDYTGYKHGFGRPEPEDRFWLLAEMGFDAVPALIEHLDDDRLTRAMGGGFMALPRNVRVGDVVSDLLENLAGQDIGGDQPGLPGQTYRVAKAEAKKWWEEARKVGEERYLLDHILPRDSKGGAGGGVNAIQLRIVLAKYPQHIATLYRTVLDGRLALGSEPLAEAVTRSKLPANEKLDLLLRAAGHKDNRHRLPALRAIKELDQKRFDALLLATIKAFPDDVPGRYWTCPEPYIAQLAVESDEPQVWQALEKAAKRAVVGFRMQLLGQFADPRDRRRRPERLRLLAGFLDDDASRDTESSEKYDGLGAGFTYQRLAVRDFVAMELAQLLGIEVERNPDRTPAEWAGIRRKVREAVEQALGKPK
jgi:hypothetical protein